MNRDIFGWHSPALNKYMEIVTYGHYGFALLLLPTAAADYLEYERFQLIDALRPFIDSGKIKVFSINSINSESWLNRHMHPRHKSLRHNQFNRYVFEEVVPYIRNSTSWDTPIVTSGASLGALHSVNLFFKRPDLINGVIGMSGVYNLQNYTDGYYDEDVYFNSPEAYLSNLNDGHLIDQMRRGSIHILSGSGPYEDPESARRFCGILQAKGIPHNLEIWGPDMRHDWPTWRAMLPYVIGQHF